MHNKAKEAEFFRTPTWAIEAILKHEILTPMVFDPCCGDGALSEALEKAGYDVWASDLNDWGYGSTGWDFLAEDYPYEVEGSTVVINPPFSLAVQFVEKALARGARKVVCFQRTNWRESKVRRNFWRDTPPNRHYICGQRATCWLGTLSEEETKGRSSPTAHGWYIWEQGHPAGCLMGDIFKPL